MQQSIKITCLTVEIEAEGDQELIDRTMQQVNAALSNLLRVPPTVLTGPSNALPSSSAKDRSPKKRLGASRTESSDM